MAFFLSASIGAQTAPAEAGASMGTVVPKAEAVPLSFGNRRPFIPMKPAEELNRYWLDAAARLPDNAGMWREIQQHLKICTGAVPTSKEMQLSALYDLVCHSERPNWQSAGALLLLKADIPELLHELLLHTHPDIVNAACDHLLQQFAKPEGGDKEEPKAESPRDLAAVPFLICVLERNNYVQMGSEEATANLFIKQKTVAILMHFMGKQEELPQVNVHRDGDVDRVLALARKWAAENGFQPLEKQRPPKAFPPREPTPAPAPAVPSGAKAVGPTAGCILFDTYMDEDQLANMAVQQIGGAGVSDRRWIKNASGCYYLVSFDLPAHGAGSINMKGEADFCKNKKSVPYGSTRKMSGDRHTYGEDKAWSF
jgi:hypothetical protein